MPRCGVLAALWLPTDADGNLLRPELVRHLDFLKRAGIHGVLALGSSGQFPQFDLGQRQRILETVAELASPLPVIANISDIRPRVVAELGKFARRLGLPGVAIMPPGFYPTTQPDVLAHLLHAAEAAELPTLLYNFPELCGTRIDLETVAAFADRADMAGIKQSGHEFSYHEELIALGREKDFPVFSGADTRLPEAFALGAAGCIGGLVNLAPESMVHLYRVCREGAAGDGGEAFERLRAIGAILGRLTFPLNLAAGMTACGFEPGARQARVSEASDTCFRGIVEELRPLFAARDMAPPAVVSEEVTS